MAFKFSLIVETVRAVAVGSSEVLGIIFHEPLFRLFDKSLPLAVTPTTTCELRRCDQAPAQTLAEPRAECALSRWPVVTMGRMTASQAKMPPR
jgi:hypothetical protein